MYRIKLTSGEEAVYNSIDALAVAVRSGEVTGDALIFHRRAERWLAINTHPHYLSIQSRQGASPQAPSVTPEATNTRAVENRDAAIQEKVKRLREMQRPIARPRPSADFDRPAPLLEDIPAALPPEPPEPLTPPVARPDPTPFELPLIETESIAAPLPLTEDPIIAPQAEDDNDIWKSLATTGQDVEPAHARPRRLPLVPIAAVLVLVAAGAGIVAWAPWKKMGNKQSVQTLASTSSSQGPVSEGSSASAPARKNSSAGSRSNVGFAGDDTSLGDVPLTAVADTTSEDPAILDVRAPRAPRLPSDLEASAGMQATMNNSASITISPAALAKNYESSYAEAHEEMWSRLEKMGFSDLFAADKLASAEQLQEARRTLALAAATIREYRETESRIEKAYQDTLELVGQRLGLSAQELQGWDTRKSLKEAPGSARMVDDLLAQIDNIYGLIAGEEGRYEIDGSTIVFENTESARRYGTLRTAITPRVSSWAKTNPAELPASLRPVIKAIGDTRPPVETT